MAAAGTPAGDGEARRRRDEPDDVVPVEGRGRWRSRETDELLGDDDDKATRDVGQSEGEVGEAPW